LRPLAAHDVPVLSGGVSMTRFDHVPLELMPVVAPFTLKPDLWYFLHVQLESSPGLGAAALNRW